MINDAKRDARVHVLELKCRTFRSDLRHCSIMVLHFRGPFGAGRSGAGVRSCAFALALLNGCALGFVANLAGCSCVIDVAGETTSKDGGLSVDARSDPQGPSRLDARVRPDGSDAGSSSTEGGLFDSGQSGTGFGGMFRHPGALITAEQIAFLRAKITAQTEPWTSALAA